MTAPTAKVLTAKELGDKLLLRHGRELAARVEKVLSLHVEEREVNAAGLPMEESGSCFECGMGWPCPTVRILNGEEP